VKKKKGQNGSGERERNLRPMTDARDPKGKGKKVKSDEMRGIVVAHMEQSDGFRKENQEKTSHVESLKKGKKKKIGAGVPKRKKLGGGLYTQKKNKPRKGGARHNATLKAGDTPRSNHRRTES